MKGFYTVGIMLVLPVPGVTVIMENDIAGDRVEVVPHVCEEPCEIDDSEKIEEERLTMYPSCVATKAMSKEIDEVEKDKSDVVELLGIFFDEVGDKEGSESDVVLDQSETTKVDKWNQQIGYLTPQKLGVLSREQLLIEQEKSVHNDVKEYRICQMLEKHYRGISKAPFKPIPAFEDPFSRVLIDCVGPLSHTKSGNDYLVNNDVNFDKIFKGYYFTQYQG